MNDCLYSSAVRKKGIFHLFDAFLGIIPSADIFISRYDVLPGIKHLVMKPSRPLKSKIPGVLFAESNCDTINGRYDVIARLKELGIRVVAPDKCLNEDPAELIENDHSNPDFFMGQPQEFWNLCRGVVFYSAIENSNCNEYITEKLANAIYCDAIPLVYSPIVDGKRYPDYSDRLPPGTYLNIADFETVEELAAHMRAIAADEELYRSYFWPKFISRSDQLNLILSIASQDSRGKKFIMKDKLKQRGGCSWNDIASRYFRSASGITVYQDCIYRFQDLTARFGLSPYKIPLDNKKWWTQEELKSANWK